MRSRDRFFRVVQQYRNNALSVRFINLLSIDMFVKLFGLVLMFVYMRIMSVSEYGIYGMIFNLISSVSLFMNFGLYIAQATFFEEFKDRLGVLIFNLNLLLFLLLSLLWLIFSVSSIDHSLLSFLVGTEMAESDIIRYKDWIWFGVANQSLVLMLSNYLIMNVNKIRVFQIYSIVKVVLVNVIVLSFLKGFLGDKSLERTRLTVIAEFIVTLPFYYYYLRLIRITLDLRLLKRALFIGIPVMCTAFITAIQGLIDRRFLLEYSGAEDLGVYTYCIVLTGNLWMFLQSFISAYLPSFLAEKDKRKSFSHTFRISKKIMLLLSILGTAMYLFAFGVDYLGLVHLKYKESLKFIPFLLLSQLILSFGAIWASYYFYFKTSYMQLVCAIISMVISALICFWLVPEFKIWGAVIASIAASVSTGLFNFSYAYMRCVRKL